MGRSVTRVKLRFIHEYCDRHGKVRRYVRRPGCRAVPLPGLPGSPEFMAAYQAAVSGKTPPARSTLRPGSLAALVADFYRSPVFANLKASSQATYRFVLNKIVDKDGHRGAADLPDEKARKIIEEIGAKRPGMANLTRAVLRQVFAYGVKTKWRKDNPFAGIESYKLGSHHTWIEDELAAYEKRWPMGTRERLAFDLLLYTGQRIGDVVRMRRQDIKNGAITLVQEKTDVGLTIPIHPVLARSLKAYPARGMYLIGRIDGRPIGDENLSKIIMKAAAKASLPKRCVPHGLRKALMRRLADLGAGSKEIAAVSGHKTLKEIERYTEGADQAHLARAAIARLPDRGKR
jgi:integrase